MWSLPSVLQTVPTWSIKAPSCIMHRRRNFWRMQRFRNVTAPSDMFDVPQGKAQGGTRYEFHPELCSPHLLRAFRGQADPSLRIPLPANPVSVGSQELLLFPVAGLGLQAR